MKNRGQMPGRALRATVRVKSIRLRARFPLGQCSMMKIRSYFGNERGDKNDFPVATVKNS